MRTSSGLLHSYFYSHLGIKLREKVLNKAWGEDKVNIDFNELYTHSIYKNQGPLEKNRFSILRKIYELAKESPSKIIFPGNYTENTASEVFSNIKKVANGLKQLGIKPGDRVALMALPHEKELFESFSAIQALGAVPVAINFLNPPNTIAYMFSRSGAKTLIVGRDSRLRAGASKLALGGLLENVITIGRTEYPPTQPTKHSSILNKLTGNALTAYNPTFFTYNSILNNPELQEEELLLNPDKNTPALELYTSGTEKKPKKMTYTYQFIANQTECVAKRFPAMKNDVMLLPAPFYHLAGLIVFMEALNFNMPIALTEVPRASEPQTVQKALNTMIQNKVTIFPGVPRIIEPVLEEAIKKGLVLENVRLILSGGSPLTPKLVQLVEKINEKRVSKDIAPIQLINFYASTECGPISSTIEQPTTSTLDRLGIPFEGVEVKTSNDDELLVRVQGFPQELSGDVLTQDGFFKTGDQIVVDNRSLIYKDRLSDRLNVNGEKISPLIIQREIEEIKGIKEVHVFGVTKPETGTDIVSAIVIPKDGYELKPNEIKKELERRFSSARKAFIPTVVFIKPEGIPISLIRGPGKVPRKLLKQFYGEEVIKEYSKLKAQPTILSE